MISDRSRLIGELDNNYELLKNCLFNSKVNTREAAKYKDAIEKFNKTIDRVFVLNNTSLHSEGKRD